MNKRQDTSLGRHSSHFRVIAIFVLILTYRRPTPFKLNNVKKIILSLNFNKMLSSTLVATCSFCFFLWLPTFINSPFYEKGLMKFWKNNCFFFFFSFSFCPRCYNMENLRGGRKRVLMSISILAFIDRNSNVDFHQYCGNQKTISKF